MMNDVFFGLMMLGGFFVLGIGMWALGQWLRRKGFGPQLDALDKQYTALQHRVNRLALPAAAHFYGGMGMLNRMPLFGSKNQVVIARACENGHPSDGRGRTAATQGHQSLTRTASSITHNPA